jgi:tetratricopeptide (TPR) repeat protein/tRNA A-37 threonylcarbamoyl transferase component Bud32/TolB-like protein
MIGKTISHYRIIEQLGAGGMGVVYKAHDTKLDRIVALKFLPSHLTKSDTDKTRFLQEAKAAAALNHPNVCTIFEIHDEGDNPFIVMEYVEGKTLRDIVHDNLPKVSDIRETIDIAIQTADALNAAHSKGIVHRDIKSENIMVTETGQVKVMDFGLAKMSGSVKLTKTSSTVGTLAYMSPEHLEGKEVDARNDIFSFGVVLYEMLTGQLPFKGEYDSAMMYSILNEEPEPLQKYRPELSSEFLHILNRALEKAPEERYQSAKDMLIDLKRLKRDTDKLSNKAMIKVHPEERVSTAEVIEKTETAQFGEHRKRDKKIILIIAAAAVIVAAISAIFLVQKQESEYVDNRIIVVPFENETGDESLDMLGQMAAEMITQGMSRINELEAVPFVSVLDSYAGKEETPAAFTIARQNRASVLITGSYYRQGKGLFFTASITDAEQQKLLMSPVSVKGTFESPRLVLERLLDKILGALIVHFQYGVLTGQTHIPPFEAYKEFRIGLESFGYDYDKARKHFYNAIQIDSSFATAQMYIATSYSNEGQYAKSDSIYKVLDKQRDKLDLFDRIMLDWGISNNSGNYARGMRMLRKAEELAPQNVVIKYLLGLYGVFQNLPKITVDTFTEFGVERLIEHSPWVLYVLAEALYMLGEYQKALDFIYINRQHYPDESGNLRYEAVLQAALGRTQEVFKVIDKSLQASDLAAGVVMIDAAEALRAHGHEEVVHEVCKRALEWYDSRPTGDHRYNIARVLYLDGRWAKAQPYFEELSGENPENLDCQGYKGVVAARLGEQEKANKILEELYKKDKPYLFGSHLHWCARIAAVLGDKLRAVNLLREAYGKGYPYGMSELLIMDFGSLKNYEPYIELMRPKG